MASAGGRKAEAGSLLIFGGVPMTIVYDRSKTVVRRYMSLPRSEFSKGIEPLPSDAQLVVAPDGRGPSDGDGDLAEQVVGGGVRVVAVEELRERLVELGAVQRA